jgi:manganese-transporting P-type ATPase
VKKDPSDPRTWSFVYQRDTYTVSDTSPDASSVTFALRPYPSDSHPPLSAYTSPGGLKGLEITNALSTYGKNEFDIPVPTFLELFGEHATAPFFVFQIFCVALWCLDEYWYYSLFTLFMLVVFECTTVSQRLRTLTEFRTMAVTPYPIQCLRAGKWVTVQTDELLPGDVVSVGAHRLTIEPAFIILMPFFKCANKRRRLSLPTSCSCAEPVS